MLLLLLLRLAMRLMRLLLHGCGAFVVVAIGSSSTRSLCQAAMKIDGGAAGSGRIENLLVSITCGGFPVWGGGRAPLFPAKALTRSEQGNELRKKQKYRIKSREYQNSWKKGRK